MTQNIILYFSIRCHLVSKVRGKRWASIKFWPTREGAGKVESTVRKLSHKINKWAENESGRWLLFQLCGCATIHHPTQVHLDTRQPSMVASSSSPTKTPTIRSPIRRCSSASSPVLEFVIKHLCWTIKLILPLPSPLPVVKPYVSGVDPHPDGQRACQFCSCLCPQSCHCQAFDQNVPGWEFFNFNLMLWNICSVLFTKLKRWWIFPCISILQSLGTGGTLSPQAWHLEPFIKPQPRRLNICPWLQEFPVILIKTSTWCRSPQVLLSPLLLSALLLAATHSPGGKYHLDHIETKHLETRFVLQSCHANVDSLPAPAGERHLVRATAISHKVSLVQPTSFHLVGIQATMEMWLFWLLPGDLLDWPEPGQDPEQKLPSQGLNQGSHLPAVQYFKPFPPSIHSMYAPQ